MELFHWLGLIIPFEGPNVWNNKLKVKAFRAENILHQVKMITIPTSSRKPNLNFKWLGFFMNHKPCY